MLRHWHSQHRRLQSANRRRFLGVIGNAQSNVDATVQWISGPPQHLQLMLAGAHLAATAPSAEHAIQDVAPVPRLGALIERVQHLVNQTLSSSRFILSSYVSLVLMNRSLLQSLEYLASSFPCQSALPVFQFRVA